MPTYRRIRSWSRRNNLTICGRTSNRPARTNFDRACGHLFAFDRLQKVAHDLGIHAHVVLADAALAANVETGADPAGRFDADGDVGRQSEPWARHRCLDHAGLLVERHDVPAPHAPPFLKGVP